MRESVGAPGPHRALLQPHPLLFLGVTLPINDSGLQAGQKYDCI